MNSKKNLGNTEIWSLLLSIEDIEDFELIDEVSETSWLFEDDRVDKAVFSYLTKAKLTVEERELLIAFYVLFNSEEYSCE